MDVDHLPELRLLLGLGQVLVCGTMAVAQPANPSLPAFKYERFDATGGALYRSRGRNNGFIQIVFVDSKDRVWVGTMTGLAVYDGKQWTNRTFKKEKGVFSKIFGISEVGPREIVEGPPGTIWLDDFCRFRDNHYEEIGSDNDESLLGTATERDGSLWVVTKTRVRKYDGKTWSTVLSPFTRTLSYKTGGLHGIAIETNGHVWIGGWIHGKSRGSREHEGSAWIGNAKTPDAGPPAAALFMFDGKTWKAIGPKEGLTLSDGDSARPGLDGKRRVFVETNRGFFVRIGETWKPTAKDDIIAGMQWVFGQGDHKGRGQLLFWDGKTFVDVRPTEHQTGVPLDLRFASWQIEIGKWAEDPFRDCVWLGTVEGLYRIWAEPSSSPAPETRDF